MKKVWADNPELQSRYERILAEQRRLQKILGIEPKTLEQRWAEFQSRQAERERQQRELEQLQSIRKPSLSLRRPTK